MEFLPSAATLLAFSAASLVLAITPGPDMTLFLGRALSDGRRAGLACVLGAMTGIAVHTSLVALGVSALVVASPLAFTALKIAGAAYLLWLAVQAIRSGSTLTVVRDAKRARSLAGNWAQGLAVNLLNPKIIIFFMTFLPQFVSAGDPAIRSKLLFLGLLFVLVSLPVVVALVLAADGLSLFLKRNTRLMRLIDYSFAGIFSLFAVRILLTQGR